MGRGPDHRERSAPDIPKRIPPDVLLVSPMSTDTPAKERYWRGVGRRIVDGFRWKQQPLVTAFGEKSDWMAPLNEAFSQPLLSHVRDQAEKETRHVISRRGAIVVTSLAVGGTVLAIQTPFIEHVARSVWEGIVGKDILPSAEAKGDNIKKYVSLYNTMVRKFGRWEDDLLRERPEGEFNSVAPIWSHSRVVDASYVGGLIPGAIGEVSRKEHEKWLDISNKYWSEFPSNFPPGYNPGPDAFNKGTRNRFNDDNLWMGLILARRHKHKIDYYALNTAKNVGDMVGLQWDGDHKGYPWKVQFPEEQAHGKGVVSNAPFIELAVELYKETGDVMYKNQAVVTYHWIKNTLVDDRKSERKDERKDEPWRVGDGLLFDNITEKGIIGAKKWTYCQGAMIGALVKLSGPASPSARI